MNIHARLQAELDKQWARRECVSVELSLPYPPSANRLWRRGRTGMIRSPRYETWAQAAGLELNAQRPGMVRGRFTAVILIERKDRRKRDLDNLTKAIFDLLQQHGVIEDDSLAERIAIEWSDQIKGCRVAIDRVPG